jgi:hypothetical protein
MALYNTLLAQGIIHRMSGFLDYHVKAPVMQQTDAVTLQGLYLCAEQNSGLQPVAPSGLQPDAPVKYFQVCGAGTAP